jgi:MATE family multidrug resistance protein
MSVAIAGAHFTASKAAATAPVTLRGVRFSPAQTPGNLPNACLRGAGDTRTTLMVMAAVNLVNIGVAWTAINGPFGLPRLGVARSALGAVAGRTVGALLVARLLLRGRAGLKLNIGRPGPNLGLVRRIMRVGLPTGVEMLAWRVGMMVFTRAVASLGTVAVAAHVVVWRTESLAFMPGLGFAIAATALVGQRLRAGDPRRAERMGTITFQLAAMLMGSIGLLLILLPRPFFGLFTDDPEVIQTAILPLRIMCAVEVLQAASFVFAGALRGAGDTLFSMIVTCIFMWVVRVPLALVLGLVLGMGLAGAWMGMALDLSLRGIIYYFRFRRGRWKLIEV